MDETTAMDTAALRAWVAQAAAEPAEQEPWVRGEQIADDIPLTVAYRIGRRIYIPCPARSPLDNELFTVGAKFDSEEGSRYVGTTKLQTVLPLIREDIIRTGVRTQILANTLTVDIPLRGGKAIREVAKAEHGAVFNGQTKLWHLPTEHSQAAVQALVDRAHTRPAQPRTTRASTAGSSKTCAECNQRGARFEALDSSGINAMVCARCNDLEPYERSFF